MSNTALILIDLINDIVHPDGKLAGKGYPEYATEHGVTERVQNAVQLAHGHGIPLILVKVGFRPGYVDHPEHSRLLGAAKRHEALQLGQWGTDFVDWLGDPPTVATVVKHRVCAFHGTDLDVILRSQGIERVVLGGVATDLAVQTAARSAHDRDFQVGVAQDITIAAGADDQLQTLRMLDKVATVGPASQLLG